MVVGNPPFLSQLGAETARGAADAARLRERFGDVVRAYTDPAALFLLRACDLAAPGGTVALVQPQSSLASRDAAGVRDAVAARARVEEIWFPEAPGFDASVDVCVPVLTVGATGPDVPWSAHLARAHGVPGRRAVGTAARRSTRRRPPPGSAVSTTAWSSTCTKAMTAPTGVPLVTTRDDRPGARGVGRACRAHRRAHLGRGRSSTCDALEGRAADWVRRTGGPKLLVATQTRVVEVAVDDDGRWIPAVPLVVVLAPVERLWPLAAALAAPAVTAWSLARTAGRALSPRALKVTAALLRAVPLPVDEAAWDRGTEAFRSGDLDGFVDAMAVAYGVGPEVGAWWVERARTVWSPAAAAR